MIFWRQKYRRIFATNWAPTARYFAWSQEANSWRLISNNLVTEQMDRPPNNYWRILWSSSDEKAIGFRSFGKHLVINWRTRRMIGKLETVWPLFGEQNNGKCVYYYGNIRQKNLEKMYFYLLKWTCFLGNVFYLPKLTVVFLNRQQSNAYAGSFFFGYARP